MGALTRRRTGYRALDLHYAVLDMETTGLDPASGARVCEIAVVRVAGDGRVLEEFSTLVDPGVPVENTEFHGIRASDVVGAPRAADVVPRLAELLSGAVVVGHNLDFEGRFLDAEFVPAGLPRGLPGLCSLRALRSQLRLERYSLPRASHRLSGLWPTGQHTAAGDARACAELLVRLLANAPGELRYTGVPPRPLPVSGPWAGPGPAGADRVRWKPRTASATGGEDLVGRVPPRPWPHLWRSLELDPGLCGGAFGAAERILADVDARRRRMRRDRVASMAVLTGGLAATAAGGLLLRRASGRPRKP